MRVALFRRPPPPTAAVRLFEDFLTRVGFAQGDLVAERYKLVELHGAGGMGAVWRAEHVRLNSPVALKFIDPGIVGSEEAIARALRPGVFPKLEHRAVVDHRFGQPDVHHIVGESPACWALRDQIAFVGRRAAHVLVTGETGTGKELIARAIHELSSRAGKRLVSRNAATIPDPLIDAELFGNLPNYPNPGTPERKGLKGVSVHRGRTLAAGVAARLVGYRRSRWSGRGLRDQRADPTQNVTYLGTWGPLGQVTPAGDATGCHANQTGQELLGNQASRLLLQIADQDTRCRGVARLVRHAQGLQQPLDAGCAMQFFFMMSTTALAITFEPCEFS